MTFEAARCLTAMANANARIVFTAAQADHDMRRYGEWHCDYAGQVLNLQREYEAAHSELTQLIKDQP